ncbi:MAG: pitrilysin family protein [Deltaproteobacteria bacterium]|nr:pitrilysin family protein [Deltaproteobacteria bacterium]
MPKSAARALAALVLFVAATLPARANVDDPALRTRVTTLDNGLTILTLADPTTPAVSFQMWVRVGSKDEARYTGLAHLFEHMMFRGTDRLPPESHERLIESRGGRVNAFTTADHTVYHADVAPDALPLVIELEAERLAHLRIGEDTLASERQVVLEERRLRTEDQPTGRVFEALLALTFMAHPYRVPVIGWRSDIEQVTVAVCRDFFDTYYAPNNIVVSITGAFDEEDALARMRRSFGGLPRVEPIPRNPTREPPQRGERRETVYFDVRSPILAATWHAPESGHPDGPALDVASLVLSGGRSSRLYRGLVYEAQQALAAEGGYWELDDAGIFYAFAMVRPDGDIARVEELFFREIERLREEPVPAAELAKARRQIEVGLLRGTATAHALGSRIAGDWVTFGRVRPIEERLAAYRAVTAADVQRVARSYLRPGERNVLHLVAPPPGVSLDEPAPAGAPGAGG